MKQRKIIKNNRQKGELGTILAIGSIIASLIGAGVSAANTNAQIEEQKAAAERQQKAQNLANNEQNSLQQQANIGQNLNDSNNLELETTKTGNIQTLNSQDQTFSAKMGGKRKFCKYGNNALSNIKYIGKFI